MERLLVRDIVVLGLEKCLEAHHDRKGVQILSPPLVSLPLPLVSIACLDIVGFRQPMYTHGLVNMNNVADPHQFEVDPILI